MLGLKGSREEIRFSSDSRDGCQCGGWTAHQDCHSSGTQPWPELEHHGHERVRKTRPMPSPPALLSGSCLPLAKPVGIQPAGGAGASVHRDRFPPTQSRAEMGVSGG